MPNYNKVLLMGNLTRDVELKYTPSNMAVANFGLAVNRKYKAGDGEMKEETTFVDCEAWAGTAENLSKWFSKGKPIFIEGRLKFEQWQDKEGNNRSRLRVVAENFQFVDSKGGGAGGASAPASEGGYTDAPRRAPNPAPATAGAAAGGKPQANTYTGPTHEPLGEEDIPF